MKELGEIVETGPDPAVDGVVRWRIDLKRVIEAGGLGELLPTYMLVLRCGCGR